MVRTLDVIICLLLQPLADAYGLLMHRNGQWEWTLAPGVAASPRYQHASVSDKHSLLVTIHISDKHSVIHNPYHIFLGWNAALHRNAVSFP